VGFYSATFEVLTEDLHLTWSVKSTAVSIVTWCFIAKMKA